MTLSKVVLLGSLERLGFNSLSHSFQITEAKRKTKRPDTLHFQFGGDHSSKTTPVTHQFYCERVWVISERIPYDTSAGLVDTISTIHDLRSEIDCATAQHR
jgi:hypothetical protein